MVQLVQIHAFAIWSKYMHMYPRYMHAHAYLSMYAHIVHVCVCVCQHAHAQKQPTGHLKMHNVRLVRIVTERIYTGVL